MILGPWQPLEIWIDDQRWPPGVNALFAVGTSLALWTAPILILSATFG